MVHSAAADQAGDFPAKTRREGDQSLVVFTQKIPVDTRTVVETILVRSRNQTTQVAIAGAVFTEQDQVA